MFGQITARKGVLEEHSPAGWTRKPSTKNVSRSNEKILAYSWQWCLQTRFRIHAKQLGEHETVPQIELISQARMKKRRTPKVGGRSHSQAGVPALELKGFLGLRFCAKVAGGQSAKTGENLRSWNCRI